MAGKDTHVFTLAAGWSLALRDLVSSARERLTIAAPFVTTDGSGFIADAIDSRLRRAGAMDFVTDLSPVHVSEGILDLDAIEGIVALTERSRLWHVPRFHAKVYVADGRRAIVTSGNLTSGGLFANVEYGLDVREPSIARVIEADVQGFRELGAEVNREQLSRYGRIAREVKAAYTRQTHRIDARLRRVFTEAVRRAEDELVRYRLEGGAMHTVFAKTILHLLKHNGPLATIHIHPLVQQLHPDLCDDTMDRVIDGKHFGKKWKHAVRTAQQQLKAAGRIEYRNGLWKLADH